MQLGDHPHSHKLKQLRRNLPKNQPKQKYDKPKEEVYQAGIDELKNAMIPDMRMKFSGKFLLSLSFKGLTYKPQVMKGKLHLQDQNKQIISVSQFIDTNCIQKQSHEKETH